MFWQDAFGSDKKKRDYRYESSLSTDMENTCTLISNLLVTGSRTNSFGVQLMISDLQLERTSTRPTSGHVCYICCQCLVTHYSHEACGQFCCGVELGQCITKN